MRSLSKTSITEHIEFLISRNIPDMFLIHILRSNLRYRESTKCRRKIMMRGKNFPLNNRRFYKWNEDFRFTPRVCLCVFCCKMELYKGVSFYTILSCRLEIFTISCRFLPALLRNLSERTRKQLQPVGSSPTCVKRATRSVDSDIEYQLFSRTG